MVEKTEQNGCPVPGCGAGEDVQDVVTSFRIGAHNADLTLVQCRKCKTVYDPSLVGTAFYEERFRDKKTLKLKEKDKGAPDAP